jgi:hypothetical protein
MDKLLEEHYLDFINIAHRRLVSQLALNKERVNPQDLDDYYSCVINACKFKYNSKSKNEQSTSLVMAACLTYGKITGHTDLTLFQVWNEIPHLK